MSRSGFRARRNLAFASRIITNSLWLRQSSHLKWGRGWSREEKKGEGKGIERAEKVEEEKAEEEKKKEVEK